MPYHEIINSEFVSIFYYLKSGREVNGERARKSLDVKRNVIALISGECARFRDIFTSFHVVENVFAPPRDTHNGVILQ